MGRASKDKRDVYYRKAKEEGYRARSAYKLLQTDEEMEIFTIYDNDNTQQYEDKITRKPVLRAVDLCAAPGSWSQVLATRLYENYFFVQQQKQRQNPSLSTISSGALGASDDAVMAPSKIFKNLEKRSDNHEEPIIVAVDLQEMAPIDHVIIVQGDITTNRTANDVVYYLNHPRKYWSKVRSQRELDMAKDSGNSDLITAITAKIACLDQKREGFNFINMDKTITGNFNKVSPNSCSPTTPMSNTRSSKKADLVVCDGAPDVTGLHELDEHVQLILLLAALQITTAIVTPNGNFVTKIFRGPQLQLLMARYEMYFRCVVVMKPQSSRNASMESFLVCKGFSGGEVLARYVNKSLQLVVPDTNIVGKVDKLEDGKNIIEKGHQNNQENDCNNSNINEEGMKMMMEESAREVLREQAITGFLSCGDLSCFKPFDFVLGEEERGMSLLSLDADITKDCGLLNMVPLS